MRRMVMLLFFALTVLQINAQEFKITSEISADTIVLGSYVEVTYALEDANGSFTPPEFKGFRIVSGPNQSSQFSMVNGVTSQVTSYGYYIMPESAGEHHIESATFVINGVEHSTPELVLIVLDNPDFDPSSLPDLQRMPGQRKSKPKPKYKVIKI